MSKARDIADSNLDSLNVDGTVTADGLTVDGSGTIVSFNRSDNNAIIELKQGGTVRGYLGASDSASTIFYNGSAAEKMRIDSSGDLKFDSGYGSVATAYGCRAWVNFNGTGTVAIRGSGNVSSITDNGTGDYTVNFASAMPDANYSTSFGGTNGESDNSPGRIFLQTLGTATTLTSSVRLIHVWAGDGASKYDRFNAHVAVHR